MTDKEKMEFIWKYGKIQNTKRINKWNWLKIEQAYTRAEQDKQ